MVPSEEILAQLYTYREQVEERLQEPIFRGLKWELIDVKNEIQMWEEYRHDKSDS